MIVLAGVIGGALWGVLLARKRGGRLADRLQYGAGFGIAFGLLGMAVTIILEKML